MENATRASLLVRVRDPEDSEAWRTFFEIYAPLVLRWCRRIGLGEHDAEDISQKVLVSISTAIRNFEYQPDKGKFRSWLFTAVRREIKRLVEKDRRLGDRIGGDQQDLLLATEPANEAATGTWMEDFATHVYRMAVERVRPEFDEESWQAFQTLWAKEASPKSVAERHGRDIAWVYKAKYRVLQRLKEEVTYLAEDFHIPS